MGGWHAKKPGIPPRNSGVACVYQNQGQELQRSICADAAWHATGWILTTNQEYLDLSVAILRGSLIVEAGIQTEEREMMGFMQSCSLVRL
jgi:hypothetical protein